MVCRVDLRLMGQDPLTLDSSLAASISLRAFIEHYGLTLSWQICAYLYVLMKKGQTVTFVIPGNSARDRTQKRHFRHTAPVCFKCIFCVSSFVLFSGVSLYTTNYSKTEF